MESSSNTDIVVEMPLFVEELECVVDAIEDEHVAQMRPVRDKARVFLTKDLVSQSLLELQNDPIVSIELKAVVSDLADTEVFRNLEWLNDCLADRRVYIQASREKVWGTYYNGLMENIGQLTCVCKNKQAAALMSLTVMRSLVDVNYCVEPAKPDLATELTERDEEIIQYITGYILRKLRSTPEAQFLKSEHQPSGLIKIKDRGGLTNPNDELVQIVLDIEKVFRHMPTINRETFQDALKEKHISTSFFSLVESLDSTADSKEQFYVDFCNLFFLVRAHHKCRQMVDQHVRATKSMRKSKALRDSI